MISTSPTTIPVYLFISLLLVFIQQFIEQHNKNKAWTVNRGEKEQVQNQGTEVYQPQIMFFFSKFAFFLSKFAFFTQFEKQKIELR
jgi:hypothetical protein